MANLIQIKRSLNTSIPSSLANGEPSYTANGDVLYIGSNGGMVAIGGKRVPGTLTANQAMVVNSTSYMDVVKTANLYIGAFTVNTINATANSTVLGAAVNSELTTTWAIKTYVDSKVAASASVGGSNTYVQFNDSASFGGTAGFTFDKATNNMFVGNTFLLGNSTVNAIANSLTYIIRDAASSFTQNSTAAAIGSNVVLSTVALTMGNSTVNAIANSVTMRVIDASSSGILNSTAVALGSNVFLSATTLSMGNSTVNALANSIIVKVENASGSANHNATGFVVGTSTINSTALVAGANVFVDTVKLSMGNSTVNALANSILVKVENASGSANLAATGLVVGTSTVNSTALVAGANVFVDTVKMSMGNTTVNALANSILVKVENATSSANHTAAGFAVGSFLANTTVAAVGANVIANTTAVYVGNSTVNAVLTQTSLAIQNSTVVTTHNIGSVTVGANVTLDTVKAAFGNTTVNTTINSTAIVMQGGGTISATDMTLSGNLTINGTLTNINATNLSVTDSIIKLANGNATTDTLDIGFYGTYGNSTVTKWTGLFRDATDGIYALFQLNQAEPSTTVNISGTGYAIAALRADIISSNVAITGGSITGITDLAVADGGTGFSTYTRGDILVANSTTLTKLNLGTTGKILQSDGTDLVYADLDGGTF